MPTSYPTTIDSATELANLRSRISNFTHHDQLLDILTTAIVALENKLGTGTGDSLNYLRLNPGSGAPTYAEGNVYWDDQDHTLAVQTEVDGVTLQVGHEFYVRATNKTGSPLLNGQVVYVNGAQGSRPTIALAQATSALSDKTIGLATYDIADNATGYVTLQGVVHDLNTLAWAEGAEIYVSAATPGALTSTRPTAPNHAVSVGVVLRQHAINGEILVHVQEGAALSEMHDVLLTTPANNSFIQYVSANSRWENKESPALTGGTYFYLRGDATTDSSVRFSSPASGEMLIENRASGAWVSIGQFK